MGGAEKALIRLFASMNPEEFDINLILVKTGGELEKELPDFVKLHYFQKINPISELKKLRILSFLKQIYYRIQIRISKSYELKSFYTSKALDFPENVANKMDAVVVYSHFNFLSICLATKVETTKRAVWVHSIFRENMDKKLYTDLFSKFDKFFCVSKFTKDEFDKNFPIYSCKSEVFYNIIDSQEISNKALETVETLMKPSLVTVGRLSVEKGQQKIPAIMRRLLDSGYQIYWYIVGSGETHDNIASEIEKYNVGDNVILLGSKSNPFPYMRNCDIYVQLSVFEGAPLVINEAKILKKPIVVTDIPAFCEQIENEVNGLIVNNDVDDIYMGIKRLLDNPELCEKFTYNLTDLNYNNAIELRKISNWLNS